MVKLDAKKITAAMKLKGVPDCSTLARRAGTTAVTVQNMLESRTPSKIMTLYKIASALGVDHNNLIRGYTK